MIKYEGIETEYHYNMEDVNRILELIDNKNYEKKNNCTIENVSELVDAINKFKNNIIKEDKIAILERKETEEEARKYFGEKFREKLDKLLTQLDKNYKIAAIHGTSLESCPKICATGLKYSYPSLTSTAVQQNMEFGEKDVHYDDYEGLLNWPHKNYKGLIILAIPYECYYKQGLWNHFADTNSSLYGGQDYKIDPEFIIGYIDVEKKEIIKNSKYKNEHDYSNYEIDRDIYRQQLNMTNEQMAQEAIRNRREMKKNTYYNENLNENHDNYNYYYNDNQGNSVREIQDAIEENIGIFNSLSYNDTCILKEDRYKCINKELSASFDKIIKLLPSLKTNEQIKKEEEERMTSFSNVSTNYDNSNWDDEFDWDFGDDSKSGKSL